MLRLALPLLALVVVCAGPLQRAAAADGGFAEFLASLQADAGKLGVSGATFAAATRGLEPDLSLPDLVLPGRP